MTIRTVLFPVAALTDAIVRRFRDRPGEGSNNAGWCQTLDPLPWWRRKR